MEDTIVKLVVLDSGDLVPIEVRVHWDGDLVHLIEPNRSIQNQLSAEQWGQVKTLLNTDESFKLKLEKEKTIGKY